MLTEALRCIIALNERSRAAPAGADHGKSAFRTGFIPEANPGLSLRTAGRERGEPTEGVRDRGAGLEPAGVFRPQDGPHCAGERCRHSAAAPGLFRIGGPGRDAPAEIPKGGYRAVFSAHSAGRAALETAETTMAARRKFWQPYLSGNAKNMLVYTDVLFFRDDSGNYLRNIYVNGLPGGAEEIQERAPAKAFHGLKPSYHFTSAGEVQSMLALIWLFARLKAPLEVRNSRFTSWNEMRSSNLILLGSSRTNAFLDALQSGNNFVITDDAIRNTAPREGEEPSYSGQRHMEGKLEKAVEPAVVTRRPGLAPGTVVTMIAANHGRGVEGAAQFLTLEGDVAAALKSSGLDNTGKLPAHFQWLLRVHIVDFDEEVISVECASHRIISTTPSCKGTEVVARDSRQDFTTFNPLLLRGSKSLQ